MVLLPLPVPVVNVLMHVLELVLGVTVFPSLLRIASIRDNGRILRNGQYLSFTSPFRIFTAGVNPGRWTISVTVYTIVAVLLLEYSIDKSSTISTLQRDAIPYIQNDGVLKVAPREVTYAARMCRQGFSNYSATFRPFAMYQLDMGISELWNSVYSRMFNESVFSCYGTNMGETLWTKGDMPAMTFTANSRLRCKTNSSHFVASTTISGVRICFSQGSRRHVEKAFELARNRQITAIDPFLFINDFAIPSILWHSSPSQEHRLVAKVQDVTKIGYPCLGLAIYIVVWVLVKFALPKEWVYPSNVIGSEMLDLHSIVVALLTSGPNQRCASHRLEGSFGTLYSTLDERGHLVLTRCEDTE